jgi:hypothetical protein
MMRGVVGLRAASPDLADGGFGDDQDARTSSGAR